MHPTSVRLYQAASELKKLSGQTAIAKLLGTTPQVVKNWEARGMSKAGILIAQSRIGCNAEWLATGKGPMSSNVMQVSQGGRRVPVISNVQAGMWREAADPHVVGDAHEFITTDYAVSDSTFALEIVGDSMEPAFKQGDRVIIDPLVQPRPGDFVVAKNGDQEATFKKFRPRHIDANGNMVFELVPLNEDYPTMSSERQHITIIGTMVEHRTYRRR